MHGNVKRRLTAVLSAALLTGLLFVAPAATVLAAATDPGCAALGGDDAGLGTECVISTFVARTGTYNLGEGLRITGAGRIDASGGGITLNLCVAPATPSATCDLTLETPTVATGGQIEANDVALPTGASASDITINLSRNVLMQAGTAILADNTVDGGNAGDITITAGGDMTMCAQTGAQPGCAAPGGNPGALISSQKMSGGATTLHSIVTITVGDTTTATGTFYMEGGAIAYGAETGAKIITDSNTGKSGSITINAGRTYFSEPGSVVQSGFQTGTSTQIGGKIFLVSNCGLTSEGRVTSKGPDPGADLVHLESCEVIIRGLVESTGVGHAPLPGRNSCNNIDNGLRDEVLRDHPAASTGCIEVWANLVTIDSSSLNPATGLPWAGELNADIGNAGGSEGTSWIDIFAYSELTVIDGTGNDFVRDNGANVYLSTYAVHANAIVGSDLNPSVVTALVKNGPLTASGKAFEASATLTGGVGSSPGADALDSDTGHFPGPYFVGNGSSGGTIRLEALGDVTLDTAFVNASGDFFGGTPCPSGSGACGSGGHIIVKAWGSGPPASNINWTSGSGDVRPNNSAAVPPPTGGDITLNACGSVNQGADFHGEVAATSTGGANCDNTQPTIPVIAPADGGPVFKPELWAACGESSISGVKFEDTNANGVKDLGEPGLSGWTIHLFGPTPASHQTAITGVGGAYSFTVLPGTYTVCEQIPVAVPPWVQTFPTGPAAGIADCSVAVDPAADNPTPGKWGYTVTITVTDGCDGCDGCAGLDIPDKDFGNIQQAIKSGVKWLDVDGDHTRDLPGDVGLNGWDIHLYGIAANGSPVHAVTTTAGAGNYSFTVLPGTYTVCEEMPVVVPPWVQTFPTAGANCIAPADPAGDNSNPGPLGYAIVLTGGQIDAGNDFGNTRTTVNCPEDPNRAAQLTRTVNRSLPDQSGGGVRGNPKNYWTVQAAYNAALTTTQAEVVGLFANTTENLLLNGSKSLTITQCTVARVTGLAGSPVWNITSTGKLTIVGPDSVGGSIGWRVAGNGGHTLKSIRANGASQYGVLVVSNGNSVSWNDVSGNGTGITDAGIRVEGSSNKTLKGGTVSNNKGDGVQLIGSGNELSGSTITGNTGNGVLVAGNSNVVKSNSRINLNGLNGILVTGSTNTLSSNASESGKGNSQNGIRVTGNTNQLTDNKMNSNGFVGFKIEGTGNKLKSNNTSSNTGNEYTIGAGNVDQGGNRKNGSGFTFTNAGGNFI